MPKEIIIPALGESITSGILSCWKVEEGSYVELDQPIYELETDKITQEGLADASGVIKFLAKEGEAVRCEGQGQLQECERRSQNDEI